MKDEFVHYMLIRQKCIGLRYCWIKLYLKCDIKMYFLLGFMQMVDSIVRKRV